MWLFCEVHGILGVMAPSEVISMSIPLLQCFSERPQLLLCCPTLQGPKQAARPTSAACSAVALPTGAWSSRGRLVASRPITAQARAWGRRSENDVLPSRLPHSPCASQKTLPAGQGYREDAVVQTPMNWKRTVKNIPNLQTGKVRPRQD